MKHSVFLWSVIATVFCVITIEQGRSFAGGPFQFNPNWFAIVPAVAIWAALFILLIRKELTAAESRTNKTQAQLAAVYANAPLDHVS